jgi:hypothetical protein
MHETVNGQSSLGKSRCQKWIKIERFNLDLIELELEKCLFTAEILQTLKTFNAAS